jgi:hypothetical protein
MKGYEVVGSIRAFWDFGFAMWWALYQTDLFTLVFFFYLSSLLISFVRRVWMWMNCPEWR